MEAQRCLSHTILVNNMLLKNLHKVMSILCLSSGNISGHVFTAFVFFSGSLSHWDTLSIVRLDVKLSVKTKVE